MRVIVSVVIVLMLSGCGTVATKKTEQATDLVFLSSEQRSSCLLLDSQMLPEAGAITDDRSEDALIRALNLLAELGANSAFIIEDSTDEPGVIVEGYLCSSAALSLQTAPVVEKKPVGVSQPAIQVIETPKESSKDQSKTSSTARVPDSSYVYEPAIALGDFETLLVQAQQGHADAQYQLGLAYESGQGVDASRNFAFWWFSTAAKQGHVLAGKKISPDCQVVEPREVLQSGFAVGDCLVSSVGSDTESTALYITPSSAESLMGLVGNYEGTAREILGSTSKFSLRFYWVSAEKIAGRLDDESGYREGLSDIVRLDRDKWGVHGLPEDQCVSEKLCIRMKWTSMVSEHSGFTWVQFAPDFSDFVGIVMHQGRAALEVSGERVTIN